LRAETTTGGGDADGRAAVEAAPGSAARRLAGSRWQFGVECVKPLAAAVDAGGRVVESPLAASAAAAGMARPDFIPQDTAMSTARV